MGTEWLGKVDWVGVLFMIFLIVTVPTCIYQKEKTEQIRIQYEFQVDSDTENGD